MSVVIDAGALIALERNPRGFTDLVARLVGAERRAAHVPATVVAQVWRGGRGRQARVAGWLSSAQVVELDEPQARAVGELLAASGTADVVDAHVALCCRDGDLLFTSDPVDLARLLDTLGTEVLVVAV